MIIIYVNKNMFKSSSMRFAVRLLLLHLMHYVHLYFDRKQVFKRRPLVVVLMKASLMLSDWFQEMDVL